MNVAFAHLTIFTKVALNYKGFSQMIRYFCAVFFSEPSSKFFLEFQKITEVLQMYEYLIFIYSSVFIYEK
jgi:hypothetical protein